MLAGSNCCAPFCFHFFRGEKRNHFEGRRNVEFHRDDVAPEFATILQGRTRPLIVDWNRDKYPDILLTYGSNDLWILLGGKETIDALSRNPVVIQKTAKPLASNSETPPVNKSVKPPLFRKLDIPELARLENPAGKYTKIGVIDDYPVMQRPVRDRIDVADWDGDGDVDLLVSVQKQRWVSDPQNHIYSKDKKLQTRYANAVAKCPVSTWRLLLLRNTGSDNKHEFAKPELLYEVPAGQKLGPFTVTDWNSDGEVEVVAALGDTPKSLQYDAKYRFFILGQERKH
jgi:hypothetical protein